MDCYGNFYHGVRNSAALEVRTLACVAAADVRSATGNNLLNIQKETGFDPKEHRWKARQDYRRPVPAMDSWRSPCLQKFLAQRYEMNVLGEDVSDVDALILSLVTSESTIFFRGIQTLATFWSLSEAAIRRRTFYNSCEGYL